MPLKQFNFLIDELDKDEFEKFCVKRGVKPGPFLRQLIQTVMTNPSILEPAAAHSSEEISTGIEKLQKQISNDLDRGLKEISERLYEQIAFLADQEEIPDDEEKIILKFENAILSNRNRITQLLTHENVENYLLEQFPKLEEEIRIKKLYSLAVTNLIEKKQVRYNKDHKLMWE